MTFHRTAGKGGTRNSRAGKHPELNFPNFNKSTVEGATLPPRKGKLKLNPSKSTVASRKRRYDRMMSGNPEWTIGDQLNSKLLDPSEVTGVKGKPKRFR